MNTAVPLKTVIAPPLNLPQHRDAFYGGKWHKAKSGRYADAINPCTGESLGPVADCGAADVDAAVNVAKAAFPAWRDTPPLERARLLKRIANVLRDHAEDIPALVEHFLGRLSVEYRRPVKLTEASLRRLQEYSWPGNVRQLRSVLENALAMSAGDTIDADDLPLGPGRRKQTEGQPKLNLEELEADAIRQALRQTEGNKAQAARLLGIHRDTLMQKLRKYGIEKEGG